VALEETKVDDILLDKCLTCGGVWFDFAEMEKAIGKERRALQGVLGGAGQDAAPALRASNRPVCPRCGDELLAVRNSDNPDLRVEACLTCYGRWVDGVELVRVRDAGLFDKLKRVLRQVG
jgi:Zn-finger nucleic acid-binding protein